MFVQYKVKVFLLVVVSVCKNYTLSLSFACFFRNRSSHHKESGVKRKSSSKEVSNYSHITSPAVNIFISVLTVSCEQMNSSLYSLMQY